MKISFRRTRYTRRKKLPLPLVLLGACAIAFLGCTIIMDAITPDRPSVTIFPEEEILIDTSEAHADENISKLNV